MNAIQKSLAESVFKQYTIREKTLQYFHQSTEAKAKRLTNVCNRILNVIK